MSLKSVSQHAIIILFSSIQFYSCYDDDLGPDSAEAHMEEALEAAAAADAASAEAAASKDSPAAATAAAASQAAAASAAQPPPEPMVTS